MTSAALVVTQTYYCVPPRGRAPHYEIHLAEAHTEYAPRLVLTTRNDTLYADALDAEGTNIRFRAEYHLHKGYLPILDALTPA